MTQHFLHSGDVGSCRDGEGGCCMAAAVIGDMPFLYVVIQFHLLTKVELPY